MKVLTPAVVLMQAPAPMISTPDTSTLPLTRWQLLPRPGTISGRPALRAAATAFLSASETSALADTAAAETNSNALTDCRAISASITPVHSEIVLAAPPLLGVAVRSLRPLLDRLAAGGERVERNGRGLGIEGVARDVRDESDAEHSGETTELARSSARFQTLLAPEGTAHDGQRITEDGPRFDGPCRRRDRRLVA
ncbi:hypothetical protein [Methylobacterium nodulans]|uniref:hypothetical protein n=1 Tax=Methylobacterium nodulans TaxID=114616 RepID=UPI0012EEA9E2|nr:hypothetical protein [Methylobacterium nodulans]